MTEELERPEFWRYWRVLPARGRIGIFLGAWTIRVIRDRLGKRISKIGFERALRKTSTGETPWILVESTDARHRNLTIAGALRDALTGRLTNHEPRPPSVAPVVVPKRAGAPTANDKRWARIRVLETFATSLKLELKRLT